MIDITQLHVLNLLKRRLIVTDLPCVHRPMLSTFLWPAVHEQSLGKLATSFLGGFLCTAFPTSSACLKAYLRQAPPPKTKSPILHFWSFSSSSRFFLFMACCNSYNTAHQTICFVKKRVLSRTATSVPSRMSEIWHMYRSIRSQCLKRLWSSYFKTGHFCLPGCDKFGKRNCLVLANHVKRTDEL